MVEPPPSQVQPDLAALYVRHREVLWRVAQSRLPKHLSHRTEDVIQDVFAKLLEKPPTQLINNWESYLVTLVRRHAITVCRKERDDRHGERPAEDGAAFAVGDGLAERAEAQVVGQALSRVEPRRRHVLERVVIADRPAKEVAAEMGISEGRISVLKKEGLQQLKSELEQQTGVAS